MSFAQGFAAGSAAAQRGVDMGLAMKKRREEEEYRKAVAGLSAEYQAGQQAQADYGAQQQANLDAGMALASPAAPTGAGALLNNAVPGATAPQGAQMSPVAPQAGGLGGAGAMPQAAMMTPPPATSYQDYQRDMAALAMQYGDTSTGISLMSAAEAADRAERLEAIRRSEFDQNYQLQANADARAAAEEARAALEADNAAKLAEGKAKIDALVTSGEKVDRAKYNEIFETYGKYGLNVGYLNETLEANLGITRQAIEAESIAIANDLRGITTTADLLEYYNKSDTLSPGYKFQLNKDEENGGFVLDHFDDDDQRIDTDSIRFSSKQEADVYLRNLAVNPTTAMQSIVTRDTAARTAAAKNKIENAKIQATRYAAELKLDAETKKALYADISKLETQPGFLGLPDADKDALIAAVYKRRNLAVPASIGLSGAPNQKTEKSDIEKALEAYDESKKAEAKTSSEFDQLVDARTGSGLLGFLNEIPGLEGFGGMDMDRFAAGYAAATPEQQAEIDKLIEERSAGRYRGLRSLLGQSTALGMSPLAPIPVGLAGFAYGQANKK